jgi:hypothetical protein
MKKKCIKWSYDIPNGSEIFQMAIQYFNISNLRPSKIYQNCYLGFKINHLSTLADITFNKNWSVAFSSVDSCPTLRAIHVIKKTAQSSRTMGENSPNYGHPVLDRGISGFCPNRIIL